MNYTNKKKIESLILLIDFLKAIDSLSHKYKSLREMWYLCMCILLLSKSC